MDRLLEMPSPMFYDEIANIHKVVYKRFRAIEESSFSWMDSVLEDARKVFNQPDACLLPKTPSAKRKARGRKKSPLTGRRNIQMEDDQDDYVPLQKETQDAKQKKQTRKRAQSAENCTDLSDNDSPTSKVSKVEKSPVGRRTRATSRAETSSRAATTSRAKKPCAAKNNKKSKSKSQEPVSNIKQLIMSEMEQNNTKDDDEDIVMYEETVTWTQSASQPIRAPKLSSDYQAHLSNTRTPIQNFNSMNVKERVHAYEEIILISPMTPCAKRKSASPQQDLSHNNTPTNSAISQDTPDTIVNVHKTTCVPSPVVDGEESVNTPIVKTNVTSVCEDNSDTTCSRRSLRKSLKALPSAAKLTQVTAHSEPCTKPVRTRTRLRLKKNEQKTDCTEIGKTAAASGTSSVTSGDTAEKGSEDEGEGSIENSEVSVPPPQNTRKTRSQDKTTQGDAPAETATGQSGKGDNSQPTAATCTHPEKGDSSQSESDTNTEEEECPTPPKTVRSMRTITGQAQNQHAKLDAEKTALSGSGDGSSSSSVEGASTPRVTRSKMRKPKPAPVEITGGDNPVLTCSATPRVTRTKTRKRQHEEGSDNERIQSKRSCTSNMSSGSDDDATPTRGSTDDSSDDEEIYLVCPPHKVVRPLASFLNTLNKNSRNPIRPFNTGGLVKSFLVRNSPAPKPTLTEIQEKRKRELAEKEKKEMERLKKRDIEHRKKMEEMRKKREEKMKKVQGTRVLREQLEKENRMQIEKRLAEKRQLTMKIREDRIKEDKEKQKHRLQKMEEAEERRKHDDEDRRIKLHEQREQERFQEEMLQRKKEFEVQERLQKIEDEKRRAAERVHEIERDRERERERLLKAEEEKQKEWQKKREERERLVMQERAEKERLDVEKKREREMQMKKEMERIKEQEKLRLAEQQKIKEQQRKRDEEIKKMVDKHNNQVQQNKQLPKPNLNHTHSLTEPSVQQNTSVNNGSNNDSYEMTPKRTHIAPTAENYGIDELDSGDETDDDECPKKKLPDWAEGAQLKTILIKQHYNPPDLDDLFGVIDPPDLNALFEKKKARFNKRTSSAHWDTPIMRPGMLGRV